MLRRVVSVKTSQPLARVAGCGAAAVSGAICTQQRSITIVDCPFWGGIGNHFLQLALPTTYTTVSALAYSPLGTLGLVLLAYNVGVIGARHLWYTMELTAKDYLQDLKLALVVRYLLLLTILLGVEALFVEC